MLLGEKHLNSIVSEFLAHYHAERPHQGIGYVRVSGKAEQNDNGSEIVCRDRLGGFVRRRMANVTDVLRCQIGISVRVTQ